MMDWIFAFGLGALSFAGLYFSKRCSRLALELAGAAILVGLAGYGWLGSPGVAGNPVSQAAKAN